MKNLEIYIASSWKNQHAVEMLTYFLRDEGHEVISWIENNYGENPDNSDNQAANKVDFESWVKTQAADRSFEFDITGAMSCDLFIYVGKAGKDAAAECGMCYAQRFTDKGEVPMIALWSKGEDFGLMRKMFNEWHFRYEDILDAVERFATKKD